MDELHDHYRNLLSQYGDSHEAVQYSSKQSQEARYSVLSEIGDLRHSSILDWGCGTGDLASWLKMKKIEASYYGVDVVQEFLDIGRKKHPEHTFGQLTTVGDRKFDWVLISGVFNNQRTDNEAFFRESILQLWKYARKGIAFNLMSSWVDYRDPDLWYSDPFSIFSFMKTITPYIVVRNEYVVKEAGTCPFEYAVYAYREPIRILEGL